MTAWCSGHFPPCMAVRRECTRNRCISRSESSVACGRVCACSGVRCPSFRVPRGRRRAAGSPPAVRPSRRRNAATVSRPIQAARRTRHGLGQGAQHAASVDARRGITQGAHGARGAVWHCGSASAVWCWQSGVPYPLRRPWWPRCSRARAAASPPPMSRLSPQHSAAAVFRPAQRDAPGQPHRTRFSVCGFGRGRGAAAQGNRQSAPQPCWACSACVHSAARLILRSGRVRVGVEQQLHHLERRALGGGVVQGQLPILRRAARRAAQLRPGRAGVPGPHIYGEGGNTIRLVTARALSPVISVLSLEAALSSTFTTPNCKASFTSTARPRPASESALPALWLALSSSCITSVDATFSAA
jgi:hypothetical protein